MNALNPSWSRAQILCDEDIAGGEHHSSFERQQGKVREEENSNPHKKEKRIWKKKILEFLKRNMFSI